MKFEQEYYVIENDGKFFGTEYEDGHCTVENYIEPFNESEFSVNVPMSKVKRVSESSKKYVDEHGIESLTYESNKRRFIKQLGSGKLRKVRVTTTIEFID